MNANAHLESGTAPRAFADSLPLLAMLGLCAAVDVAGISLIAQHWDAVVPYVPYFLLAVGIGAIVYRAIKVLRTKD